MPWDKRSRHARGYGTEWTKLRAIVMQRDAHLCQPCKRKGKTTPARQVDHITPKAKGGTDDTTNLQAICKPCHSAKTEAESAEAQGRTYRPKVTTGLDGWPEA
jgi:5-methylcytosine-specific restriction protein A